MDKPRRRRHARGATLTVTFTCLLLDGALGAAEAVPKPSAPSLAGDELALFADLPVVVSATRQATPLALSPVPVSVLGSDAIHDGAAITLAEAVQFMPGIDYTQSTRNIQAVGIRGLHGTFSDRMLTLVNGRNADNAAYGGSQFNRLPVLLADIDHIEVVRGPGGAVWGPNAFNGVLNIITKEPEDMLGVFGTITAGSLGDSYGQARWCESIGAWSWRTSVGGRGIASSRNALDDPSIPNDDWSKTVISDNELVWRPTETTKVRAGLGYARGEGGTFEITGYESTRDMTFWNLRSFAKLDQQLEKGTALHVQWYGNRERYDLPTIGDMRTQENVVDGQLDLAVIRGHQLSFGAEARRIDIDVVDSGDPNQVSLANNPYREYRAGAYLIDSWTVTQALTIEGQIRGDRYTGTDNDWAGRLATLYALDHEHRRVMRLAAARSYRTPLPIIRDSQASHPILGGALGNVVLLPSDNLQNEELQSFEAGYTHQFGDGLLLRFDNYYQRYEHLVGYQLSQPALGLLVAKAVNLDGATGYGSEVELAWNSNVGRISGWYAFNYLDTDRIDQSLRAFEPSRHKVGASGHLPLGNGFAFNANYRYASTTSDSDSVAKVYVPVTHRLDLNIAWRFARARGELMAGVNDLTNTRLDAVNGTGSFTAHDTPGRSIFVRGEFGF